MIQMILLFAFKLLGCASEDQQLGTKRRGAAA
jgi:hypothetical protein